MKHLYLCTPCQRGMHTLCTGNVQCWDHPHDDQCACAVRGHRAEPQQG